MSTTPDPASSTAATEPDEAEAVEATRTAEAVEPETTDDSADDSADDTAKADRASATDAAQTPPPTAPTPSSSTSSPEEKKDTEQDTEQDTRSDDDGADGSAKNTDKNADEDSDGDSDEDRRKSAEEFAAEHDPANHDIAAGEEFRQPGDWTADDAGGPQVFDDKGNLVSEGGDQDSGDDAGSGSAGGRRVSDLDEVRDGGYSVGSAATLHDGAMPLGHPVKAWEDTKTFVTEDHDHYDEAEPDVWFTDADAAQRAGFRPAD